MSDLRRQLNQIAMRRNLLALAAPLAAGLAIGGLAYFGISALLGR